MGYSIAQIKINIQSLYHQTSLLLINKLRLPFSAEGLSSNYK